ncbi:MAG: Hsp70 family protein [Acidimicrobiales bacterium]|nr:Hsp70 family protein [Acidimicrobiales bacterium]
MRGSYRLGVDLGTTYSAAAVLRDGEAQPEMVRVDGDPVVPSVVFLTSDGEELVGTVAAARAWDDPARTSREFKRRLGDPVPIIVGGSSYSAQRLAALVLRRIVDVAAANEGAPPGSITLTHPANWGPYKVELFAQVPDLAGLGDAEVRFLTEPEAAAISYAADRPVETGDRLAVYDLGGGTFDAAVVERTAGGGFEILGTPQGIEQLGGVDFDDVVLHHVQASLAERFAGLDRSDPEVTEGFAHLRDDCCRAKELLSADTAATVRVNLPALLDRVRITRAEFEDLIRPTIRQTITTLDATIASAGLASEDLSAVLLVGGSSRIPLISDLLGEHYGRPVVLDVHPKFATARGAALPPASASPPPVPAPLSPPPPVADAAASHAVEEPAVPGGGRGRRKGPLVAAALVLLALVGGGAAWALTRGDDSGDRRFDSVDAALESDVTTSTSTTTTTEATTTTTEATTTTAPRVTNATTPEDAVTGLFTAWAAGDEDGATLVATPGVIELLLALEWPDLTLQDCREGNEGFACDAEDPQGDLYSFTVVEGTGEATGFYGVSKVPWIDGEINFS